MAKVEVDTRESSERFSDALTELMRERNLTYRQLAYKTHLSAGYLNHLSKGNRAVPPDDAIRTLARALRVRPDYFLEFRQRRLAALLEQRTTLLDYVYAVTVLREPVVEELVQLLHASRDD